MEGGMREIYQSTSLCLLFAYGIACAGEASWQELMLRSEELSAHGKFREAESALLSALKAAETFSKPDLRLAETQHRLGEVYRELGRLPEAEKWCQRSLSTWKESVPERDPSLAKPLISLTSLYLESGLPNKAERLLAAWLHNPLQTVDATDALSVRLLHNHAALQYAQRKHATAETLYRQALKAAETVFGPQSHEVALLLNNLGVLLADTGRAHEAGSHLERALAICQVAPPPDHPDVARALTNLAAFHTTTGAYAKAEPLFHRALAIAENRLGPESRLVGKILAEYAVLLRKTKRKNEAKRLETRAEAIQQQHAPEDLGRHTIDVRDLLTPADRPRAGTRSPTTR
jgi:tetratricopeptide (TPR) repeat protein